ncbi:MAG: hypothetical protein QM520_03195, partial [Gammaproteobacteria bacterium]|nr:hypothetical protein [Gammaproteobacteria bacterium]
MELITWIILGAGILLGWVGAYLYFQKALISSRATTDSQQKELVTLKNQLGVQNQDLKSLTEEKNKLTIENSTLAERVQSFQREINQLKDTIFSLQNTLVSKEDALKQSISDHLKLTGEN